MLECSPSSVRHGRSPGWKQLAAVRRQNLQASIYPVETRIDALARERATTSEIVRMASIMFTEWEKEGLEAGNLVQKATELDTKSYLWPETLQEKRQAVTKAIDAALQERGRWSRARGTDMRRREEPFTQLRVACAELGSALDEELAR